MVVRRVIIGDGMRLKIIRDAMIAVLERGQEILVPMPGLALRNDCPVEHVNAANSVVVPFR
jgi:hypothetical protein